MIRILAMLKAKQPEPMDDITALRNENSARLAVEKNTTRRGEIIAEQKRLTMAALRKGVK